MRRYLLSGLSAALVALLFGTLIATLAGSARAADEARARDLQAASQDSALADAQAGADLAAYRAKLDEAVARLDAAYRDLAARDAAYRALLASADGTQASLEAANRELAAALAAAAAQASATVAAADSAQQVARPSLATPTPAQALRSRERVRYRDD